MPRDIVLGYDDSDCAKAALDVAIDVARAFGDRIVVAYAYAPPQRLVGEEYRELERALRELGEHATADALARLRDAGVDVEIELVPEKPASALIALAQARNARMIVVGTHGEGSLTGALLGSVPQKLLHRSPIPVLVVPAV
jgi:nucleotide-binding universal stress UspA family protein